jgi:hypothetical protein
MHRRKEVGGLAFHTEGCDMAKSNRAEEIVREIERVSPYMYEGLYGNFLRNYMDSDKSKWTSDLSNYLTHANNDWADVGLEVASLLWERFERRITC